MTGLTENRLRLAFSTLGCPAWSWEEVVARGKEYGYDGIEIRMIEGEVDLLSVPEFQPGIRAGSLSRCRDAGLVVCGLASSIRFHERDHVSRSAQYETGRGYLELASDLEAGFIRVFGDVLSEEAKQGNRVARNDELKWIAEGLSRMGDLAQPYGIEILLETHGDFTATDDLPELMRLVNHPQVGLLWDTHHPWRFHGEDPDETWHRIGPWVRHTHWKDSDSRLEDVQSDESERMETHARSLMSGHKSAHYCRFGEGEFPAANCLERVRSGGYCGWYCLEWEKAWHPEIADPTEIFPQFANRFRAMYESR